MIHKADRTIHRIGEGDFVVDLAMPGKALPGHDDYGLAALAVVADSFMAPGAYIPMHEHLQDEIISYVPQGVMRHDDLTHGKLVTDADHLMVMNAGSGFWHEERTLRTDPPLRMLQIFVRPHTLNLEPRIQHGRIEASRPNHWRHLFGPEGDDAPFYVRNDVHLHDIRLTQDSTADLPAIPEWITYFYIYSGTVVAGGKPFNEREAGVVLAPVDLTMTAVEDALVVAFVLDPSSRITREGSAGDGVARRLLARRNGP